MDNTKKKLNKRLMPLYAAEFFQGFVLWYSVEKVFLRSIGFNDFTLGLELAFLAVIILIVGIPSGILADRWSRRGVLMIAAGCLLISSIFGGLSYKSLDYLVTVVTWGVFFGLYSGTNDSIIYDTLLEESAETDNVSYYFGRMQIVNSLALIIGSLLGGVAAQYLGLRATYFLSIPTGILALVALALFREPTLHKTKNSKFFMQFKETLQAVGQEGRVFWIVAALFFLVLGQRMMFEYFQLWLIALALPIVLFGPITALVYAGIGVSGVLAPRLKGRWYGLGVFLFLSIAAAFALTVKVPIITVAGLVFTLLSTFVMIILMNGYLHEELPSNLRAGGASAAATLSQLGFVPAALGFGYISHRYTTFRAAWLTTGIMIAAMVCVTVVFSITRSAPKTLEPVEEYLK